MQKKHLTLMAAVAMLYLTSCNKELFDKQIYNDAVDYQFMLDNVDRYHNWQLTKYDVVTIKTSTDIYSIKLLTTNPYTSSSSEIIAEAVCYGNEAKLGYTIPITQSTLYVAALNEAGDYLGVKSFAYGTKELDITTSDLQYRTTMTTPTPQTYTFLYESTFPMPEDFDFNDMVLRISKSLPDVANSFVVDVKVTLVAAGASELYAAAIQLAGINYDDVTKVEIVEGKAMDEGYPLQRLFITDGNTLIKGRNGEAVINLFECAQWALSKQKNELGDISVLRYNTVKTDSENYSATASPVTATYRITFKERQKARNFTLDQLDPFIIHQNTNGGIWEVHTYPHKFDETLRELYFGQQSAYDNSISWAVVVPKGDFRYPVEGNSISGFNQNTSEVFGPYEEFVKWMHNHVVSQDWYLTITRPQLVY